jgi:hypothetical protein
MNKQCEGCFYEDEACTHHVCSMCSRNNLSGYYLDEYINDSDFYSLFTKNSIKNAE